MSRLNKKDYIAKYGEEAWEVEREKRREYQKEYYNGKGKEKRKAWLKEYREKNKKRISAISKKYRDTHDLKEYRRNAYLKLKESGWYEERYNKKEYRASYKINTYRRDDKLYNRGDCTLTKDWIIDNIFSSSCVYCGESDWRKLGCDRIDNTKAHTPDNVVCACWSCNNDRHYKKMSVEDYKNLKASS